MKDYRWIVLAAGSGLAAAFLLQAAKTDGLNILTGPQAFSNTTSLKPGQARKITVQDLPKPGDTPSGNTPGGRGAVRPANAIPQAPAGFKVDIYVGEELTTPRQMRRAPNGDIFVADTSAQGGVRIFRGITADGKPQQSSVFAAFPRAFGINFYPPGPNPQWVYVTSTTTLVRYAYKNGDLKASGAWRYAEDPTTEIICLAYHVSTSNHDEPALWLPGQDDPVLRELVDDPETWFVAHNAGFDMGFINAELTRHGFDALHPDRFIDTVSMARRMFPGAPASLDALAKDPVSRVRLALAAMKQTALDILKKYGFERSDVLSIKLHGTPAPWDDTGYLLHTRAVITSAKDHEFDSGWLG